LVGTSRGKVQQYERQWLELPWQKVRESVEVKLFAQDGELLQLHLPQQPPPRIKLQPPSRSRAAAQFVVPTF